MLNLEPLRQEIRIKSGSLAAFCLKYGYNPGTMGRKMAGNRSFTREEIASISRDLKLTNEEIIECFFNDLTKLTW